MTCPLDWRGKKLHLANHFSSKSFPGTTSMSGCLENCQKYIPKSLFSPMQETRFLNAYCVFYCIVFYCVLLIDFILVLRRLFINCSGNFGYSSWNTIWIIGEILEFLPVVKLQDGKSHTKC